MAGVKHPFGIFIPLNIFILPFGALGWLRGKFPKALIPFFFLVLYSFVLIAFYPSVNSFLRSCQLILMLGVALYFDKFRVSSFVLYTVIFLTIFSIPIDFYLDRYERDLFGISFPRVSGFLGEPNYLGIYLFSIYIMFCFKVGGLGSLRILFLVILVCLLTGSRGVLLGILGFFAAYFILFRSFFMAFFVLAFYFSIPVFFYFLLMHLDSEYLHQLNDFSSGRLALWNSYLNMFLDNPLGVGYFQGQSRIGDYLDNEMFGAISEQQAHSLHFQILGDLGLVGYFLAFIGIVKLAKISSGDRVSSGAIFFLVFGFSTLNFLNEFSFWALVGLVVGRGIYIFSFYEGGVNRKYASQHS